MFNVLVGVAFIDNTPLIESFYSYLQPRLSNTHGEPRAMINTLSTSPIICLAPLARSHFGMNFGYIVLRLLEKLGDKRTSTEGLALSPDFVCYEETSK